MTLQLAIIDDRGQRVLLVSDLVAELEAELEWRAAKAYRTRLQRKPDALVRVEDVVAAVGAVAARLKKRTVELT